MREHVPAVNRLVCDRCDEAKIDVAPPNVPPIWGHVAVVQSLDGTLTRRAYADLCPACLDVVQAAVMQVIHGLKP